jgi:hypothetical protein
MEKNRILDQIIPDHISKSLVKLFGFAIITGTSPVQPTCQRWEIGKMARKKHSTLLPFGF